VESVVVTHGLQNSTAPLVVLLHGRGSHEREIIALADRLPQDLAYAAIRGPIPETSTGYTWFVDQGAGKPLPKSLRTGLDTFRHWLDDAAPPHRPVVLAGFSSGAVFAGGLVLDDPDRYAGVALICGTLPFAAGVPMPSGRLDDLPVFVAQGDHDTVIPRDLQIRTWEYLRNESGAAVTARRDLAGHEISPATLTALGLWLSTAPFAPLALRSNAVSG
jgi:phospholipase/carboxylesterase